MTPFPSTRARAFGDVIVSLLVVLAMAALVLLNWDRARRYVDDGHGPRLRIAVVAARPLGAGDLLRASDLAVRLRRPIHEHYFDAVGPLVARQLLEEVTADEAKTADARTPTLAAPERGDLAAPERGGIIYGEMLAEPSSSKAGPVAFLLPVERAAALALGDGDSIMLVPQTEDASLRCWPEVTVVGCPAADDEDADTVTIRLRAKSARDAMQVAASAAGEGKLVPLILAEGAPCARAPEATAPAVQRKGSQ